MHFPHCTFCLYVIIIIKKLYPSKDIHYIFTSFVSTIFTVILPLFFSFLIISHFIYLRLALTCMARVLHESAAVLHWRGAASESRPDGGPVVPMLLPESDHINTNLKTSPSSNPRTLNTGWRSKTGTHSFSFSISSCVYLKTVNALSVSVQTCQSDFTTTWTCLLVCTYLPTWLRLSYMRNTRL